MNAEQRSSNRFSDLPKSHIKAAAGARTWVLAVARARLGSGALHSARSSWTTRFKTPAGHRGGSSV